MSDTYTGPTNVTPENENEARLIARAEAQGIERASLTRDPWGELWIAGELPLCFAVDDDDPAPEEGAGAMGDPTPRPTTIPDHAVRVVLWYGHIVTRRVHLDDAGRPYITHRYKRAYVEPADRGDTWRENVHLAPKEEVAGRQVDEEVSS